MELKQAEEIAEISKTFNEAIKQAVVLMKQDEEKRWRKAIEGLQTSQKNFVLKRYEEINKTHDIDYPRTLLIPSPSPRG